jgi:pyruvate/oxaloacetate carboxyltransferase
MRAQTNIASVNASLKRYGYPIRISMIAALGGFLFDIEIVRYLREDRWSRFKKI